MTKIQVTNKSGLDELYNDSALTIEGLSTEDDSLKDMIEWIKQFSAFKKEDVYVIEGSVMNREYGLTGTNAYPETGFTLVAVKLADLEKPLALTLPRFQVGGRWFDDVVNNNLFFVNFNFFAIA